MRNQWVESGEVFDQIYDAAELYGIFDDLFQHAHFWPCLMLQVCLGDDPGFIFIFSYSQVEWLQEDGETLVPVHRGNLVKPGECTKAPEVSYLTRFKVIFLHKVSWDSPENALWTLAMVGPDSQLQGEGEVLHWLVANIPGNKVEDGQTLAPYLQPHPAFGTGYHRYELLCSCPGSFWLTPDVSRKASQKMHPFLFPLLKNFLEEAPLLR